MSTHFPKGCAIRRINEQHRWVDAKRSELKPADSIAITSADGSSCLFTCYRPPRPRDMSPVQYYKRFKCVPDDYLRKHRGRYYCNPAHCKRSWADLKERNKHVGCCYGILG